MCVWARMLDSDHTSFNRLCPFQENSAHCSPRYQEMSWQIELRPSDFCSRKPQQNLQTIIILAALARHAGS